MSRPEDLRQITESTLHSLIADDSLKYRILQKAALSEKSDRTIRKQFIPAFCTVLVVLLIAAVTLNSIQAVPVSAPGKLNSFAAGGAEPALSLPFPDGFDPDSVISVEIENLGTVDDPERCSLLIQLLLDQSTPADQTDTVAQGNLIVTLSGGSAFLLEVRDHYLISQGNQCWSCPAFFNEFNNMIR